MSLYEIIDVGIIVNPVVLSTKNVIILSDAVSLSLFSFLSAFKALIPGYIIRDWDNTYSSMSSLEKGSCNSESGSQTCKIDFSMVYSDKLEPMYTTGGEGMTQEEIVALLGSLTLDDIYVIIYNNDPSTPQYSHVNDSIDYYIENNLSEISSLVNFDIEDI